MTTRLLSFFFLLFFLASCDKYYEGELIIENNTSQSITVRYQIDFNPDYNRDSIYQAVIDPYNKKSIYNDPSSLGMKCEEVNSTQEKIYFLNILSITNSSNESCLKAYNDCSVWKFETKIRKDEFDLITYSLVLNEDDF
ncbi:hypothetical protein SDC9_55214 [bioreactor metagenome]|uniref:Lipoprotein n=1 Tax=bioreactor metagenome TaxID=1076179 RepID=A0A644WZG5_9ZZZZ